MGVGLYIGAYEPAGLEDMDIRIGMSTNFPLPEDVG